MPPSGPRPGPWRTDYVPYARAPLDAFADPRYEVVYFMVAAQMSKTEALLNVAGWHMDCYPRECLIYEPTEKLARTLSRTRLDQMLHTAPGLRDKMDSRYMKPGSLERFVSGARLGIGWMGSKVETASHPAAMVLVDEIDLAVEMASDHDPIGRAYARTKAFPGAKLGCFSTPTYIETSAIYNGWRSGTKMRWAWTCPDCGHQFAPELQHARYPEKAEYATIRDEAWIECPECAHQIRDEDREGLTAEYVPYVERDGLLEPAPGIEPLNSVASYWATGFASPITGIGKIMEQYARAARDGQIDDVRSVVTEWAGEPWKESGDRMREDDVRDCQRPDAPDGDPVLVTGHVDVQKDSLYFVLRGWWPGTTSMLGQWGQVHGSTEFDDVWLALQQEVNVPVFGRMPDLILVDCAFNTAQALEWCRRNPRWMPSRGRERMEAPFAQVAMDRTLTGRVQRQGRRWDFNTDTWKTWLYARIAWAKDQPGAWFVPQGIEDRYCSQVTNEEVRIVRGKRQWVPTRDKQNHLLDCEVGAAVAAHILNIRALRARRAEQEPEPEPQRGRPSSPRSPFARRGL